MNLSILSRKPARSRGAVSLIGRPQQQQQRTQPPPQAPRMRMPAVAPCAAPRTPARQTVVVDDMVVLAEDTDDSDYEIVDDSDEQDSDGETKPRVIKVVTRKPAAAVPTRAAQPAYCALLRRTPTSRTASIACTLPAAASRPVVQPRPLQPRPVPQQGHPSLLNATRIINVPARVLVPRNRLVFPVAARGRPMAVGRPIGPHVAVAPAPGKPAVAVQGHGRLRRGGRVQGLQAVSVLTSPWVYVSANGPLTTPEKAVLDGVLEMEEEQWRRGAARAASSAAPESPVVLPPLLMVEVEGEPSFEAQLMDKYGVSPLDTFHGDFEIIVAEI